MKPALPLCRLAYVRPLVVSGLLWLALAGAVLQAQTPDQNLRKYWIYRERLKNYVVVGDCQGCSIPASGRGWTNNWVPSAQVANGTLSYDDSGGRMGYYIAMLATEYKLLKDHGQTNQLQNTALELYYALEALNRLDLTAEYWWRDYYQRLGPGAPSYPKDDPTKNDLNGFLISDDVAANFPDTVFQADYIENQLNKGLVPPPDGSGVKGIDSGFSYYTSRTSCGQPIGPRETSIDHLGYQLVGLALVAALIDFNDPASLPFADGEIRFVQEVQNICRRITQHLKGDSWFHDNPITGECVHGVTWTDHCLGISWLCPCPNCDGGGAKMAPFAYGWAFVNSRIQSAPFFTSDAITQNYFDSQYTGDDVVGPNQSRFNTWYRWLSIGREDYKVLTYAALGNLWGDDTADIVGHRCRAVDAEHLPLLHQVLYGGTSVLPSGLYTCMLNSAPCFGNSRHDGTYEWSNGDRIYGGPNRDGKSYNVESTGIDYLLYFNLYLLANPDYLGGTAYRFIPPTELCPVDVYKHDYTESDVKNFLAMFIYAGNNYSITNDHDPNQPLTYAGAQVSFTAAKQIRLTPGFTVAAGATFHASIDPALQPMVCVDGPGIDCTDCIINGNEEQSGRSIGAYKLYPGAANELYAATPHYLFKIQTTGGTGGNMFGIKRVSHHFEAAPGYPYLLGYQEFRNVITDVHYVNGFTFVSFDNGKMLKVNGSGGTGQGMFAIQEDANQIWADQNSPYYAGSQKFEAGITAVAAVDNSLLIGLANGDLLRVGGVGGTGENMFAVTEYGFLSTFAFAQTGPYYEGDQRFNNAITLITPVNGETFIGLGDGKLLKVSGPGGTGHHMFGVAETHNGFNPEGGGGYLGYQKFLGAPVNVTYDAGITFIAMNNGKILKVLGTGGTGGNMFAVNEDATSFSRTDNYPYYLGYDRFRVNGLSADVVRDILPLGGSTLLSFSSGRILKVEGAGGTGGWMFNVDETSRGFGVHAASNYAYYQGCMNFRRDVTSMTSLNGVVVLGLANGKMVKVLGTGGTGENLYSLADANCIQSLCGNLYWIGCEDFASLGAD